MCRHARYARMPLMQARWRSRHRGGATLSSRPTLALGQVSALRKGRGATAAHVYPCMRCCR